MYEWGQNGPRCSSKWYVDLVSLQYVNLYANLYVNLKYVTQVQKEQLLLVPTCCIRLEEMQMGTRLVHVSTLSFAASRQGGIGKKVTWSHIYAENME